MPFTPKLDLIGETANGKPLYELIETFTYKWEKDGRTFRIRIPAGFKTDVASTPQIAWSLGFLPDGKHRTAALIHDWQFLWHRKGTGRSILPTGSFQMERGGIWQEASRSWTFTECNRMFGRLMREAGVGPIKRKLMFSAVQIFGLPSWHGIDEEDQLKYEALCRLVL